MNINFVDTKQKIIVKILENQQKAENELVGSRAFAKFAVVPEISRLDNKTLSITLIDAQPAAGIKQELLNKLILNFFRKVSGDSDVSLSEFPNIYLELKRLKDLFSNESEIVLTLKNLEKNILRSNLFPIHGDLQKQNLFVKEEQLILVDFEHFMFAPLELDIVNSLFFKDYNCLNVDFIIKNLVDEKIFSIKMIKNMLIFYSIKQMAQGRRRKDCEKRLKDGLDRLYEILPNSNS